MLYCRAEGVEMKRVLFCLGIVWQSELKEPVTLSSP
jgi:hypothetical protein